METDQRLLKEMIRHAKADAETLNAVSSTIHERKSAVVENINAFFQIIDEKAASTETSSHSDEAEFQHLHTKLQNDIDVSS